MGLDMTDEEKAAIQARAGEAGGSAARRGSQKVTIEVPMLRWLAARLSRVSASYNVTPEELVAIAVGRLLALGDADLFAAVKNNDERGD